MNSNEKEICRNLVAQGKQPQRIADFLQIPLEEVLLASLSSAPEKTISGPPLILEHVGDINPSHETCEGCGALLSGVLSIQVWTCPECEFINDRRL
jgi:hypothetical protein